VGKGAGCEEWKGWTGNRGLGSSLLLYVCHVHAAFAVEATGVKICYCMLLLFEAFSSFLFIESGAN